MKKEIIQKFIEWMETQNGKSLGSDITVARAVECLNEILTDTD